MNLVKKIKKLISVNKSNLKTAFKVWLFFAVLKAIVVVLVWFGFVSLISNVGSDYSSHVHVYGDGAWNRSSEVTSSGCNSSITTAMLSLVCTIVRLKQSPDGATGGADDGIQRHVGIIQRAVRDGSVSMEDLEQLVKFGTLLDDVISKIEGSGRIRTGISGPKSEHFVSSGLRPELIKLIQYVQNRKFKHIIATNENDDITLNLYERPSLLLWQKWQNAISQEHLYDNRSITDQLLHILVTAPIIGARELPGSGTQVKLLFKLQDGSRVIFKPMRVSREQERNPDIFFWNDLERHHAEIAAFHLDRILGFHRVPPTVGRFINISSDIERFASDKLRNTIYTSPAGNKCFFGNCNKYCDGSHPVCGNPGNRDVIEGSIATWLPFDMKRAKKQRWKHPWMRSYSRHKKAEWETNDRYCDVIRTRPPYNKGRRLLDIIDMAIFDYLTGNPDRHSYHIFKIFGNDSSPIHYDNGRGFGLIRTDDPLILYPLTQCCLVRHTTLHTLTKMAAGPETLSVRMRRSLDQDPLSSGPNGPLLSKGNLEALDRRLINVLDQVWECGMSRGLDHVVINDGH